MAFLTESQVRQRASRRTATLGKSLESFLAEASDFTRFDIFLSHSSAEPDELVDGVKLMLEDLGLKVYVDRYGDPNLDPRTVTPETAEILRRRLCQSDALLYIYSRHSTKSRWMPWELGFMDGKTGKVGVLPVTQEKTDVFLGEEYLGVYPNVDWEESNSGKYTFWLNEKDGTYQSLASWVGKQLTDC